MIPASFSLMMTRAVWATWLGEVEQTAGELQYERLVDERIRAAALRRAIGRWRTVATVAKARRRVRGSVGAAVWPA